MDFVGRESYMDHVFNLAVFKDLKSKHRQYICRITVSCMEDFQTHDKLKKTNFTLYNIIISGEQELELKSKFLHLSKL